jgi:hypothetical protein
MAAHDVPRTSLDHDRVYLFADIHDIAATCMKTAARWHIDRAGNFSPGYNFLRFERLFFL